MPSAMFEDTDSAERVIWSAKAADLTCANCLITAAAISSDKVKTRSFGFFREVESDIRLN